MFGHYQVPYTLMPSNVDVKKKRIGELKPQQNATCFRSYQILYTFPVAVERRFPVYSIPLGFPIRFWIYIGPLDAMQLNNHPIYLSIICNSKMS